MGTFVPNCLVTLVVGRGEQVMVTEVFVLIPDPWVLLKHPSPWVCGMQLLCYFYGTKIIGLWYAVCSIVCELSHFHVGIL